MGPQTLYLGMRCQHASLLITSGPLGRTLNIPRGSRMQACIYPPVFRGRSDDKRTHRGVQHVTDI